MQMHGKLFNMSKGPGDKGLLLVSRNVRKKHQIGFTCTQTEVK